MGYHTNYWSCSRFADWLRGTKKLNAGTSREWREWQQAGRQQHPIRYWLAEEGLDLIQDTVTWPARKLNDLRYYINNRFISHSHACTAHARDIKPGAWCDLGDRFLPCLFNELVDFVEVESAWTHVIWDDEARKKFKVPMSRSFFRWRTWRSPEAGLEHLKWAASLRADETWGLEPGDKGYGEPTFQARGAQEILALYHWWTQERPQRPDPHDASGWTEICDRRREAYPDELLPEDATSKEKAETKRVLNLLRKLEKQHEKEDEDMMIRLIRIRQALWT